MRQVSRSGGPAPPPPAYMTCPERGRATISSLLSGIPRGPLGGIKVTSRETSHFSRAHQGRPLIKTQIRRRFITACVTRRPHLHD